MNMFSSYVKLPEGIRIDFNLFPRENQRKALDIHGFSTDESLRGNCENREHITTRDWHLAPGGAILWIACH
jgi:hypothetical protein